MREVLVKLSDKFDQEKKHDLADAVDEVIKSAARPKAPLKKMDEDVKKDLMRFLTTVKKNMEDSMESLEELFRRLRYFDIGDIVKELGLDKAIKDMKKTHDCVDGASKTMYALTHGKHPSKADMEQLADDFGLNNDEKSSPLDFFEKQHKTSPMPEKDLVGLDEEDELLGSFIAGPGGVTEEQEGHSETLAEGEENLGSPAWKEIDEEDLSDEEYEDFMRNMEEYKEFMESPDEGETESFEDEG